MSWLRKKLKKWLGIEANEVWINGLGHRIEQNERDIETLDRLYTDLTSIGIDVHFKSPHMILIFSKLNGGQIHHIDANFKDIRELMDFVRWLKEKYRPKEIYWDAPPSFKESFKEEL